jgi:hypothetical protein
MQPIVSRKLLSSDSRANEELVQRHFSTLDQIYAAHATFEKQLFLAAVELPDAIESDLQWISADTLKDVPDELKKKDFSQLDVSGIFLSVADRIDRADYSTYCGNLPESRMARTEALKTTEYSTFVESVLQRVQEMKDVHIGYVDTMMDEPVMRLSRFRCLLEVLYKTVKQDSGSNEDIVHDVSGSLKRVKEIAQKVDDFVKGSMEDRMREAARSKKLLELTMRMTPDTRKLINLNANPNKRCLRVGTLHRQ